jgi:hypothetical protein
VEPTTASTGGALQLLLLLLFIVPAIFFLRTEFNTLKLIRPENRAMQPGWVWLQLIPLAGQVWQFVVVAKISSSISNQWQTEDEDSILGINAEAVAATGTGKPTLVNGIIYCTLNAVAILCNLTLRAAPNSTLAMIVGVIALVSMASWVLYWINLASWKRRLKNRVQFSI